MDSVWDPRYGNPFCDLASIPCDTVCCGEGPRALADTSDVFGLCADPSSLQGLLLHLSDRTHLFSPGEDPVLDTVSSAFRLFHSSNSTVEYAVAPFGSWSLVGIPRVDSGLSRVGHVRV